MFKKLVWLAVAFALYAGWCHFPAYLKHTQLEGSVQNVLDHAQSHGISDAVIVQKALTAAGGLETPIGEDDIRVRRGSRTGERSIHVEFAMPIEIDFLGSTKTVVRQVAASRTFAVNEAQLARQEEQRAAQEMMDNEQRQRDRNERVAYKARLEEECAAKGDLITTHVMVTHGTGEQQIVECSDLAHW